MDRPEELRSRIRIALGAFVIGLVLSGLTAFPLLTEVEWLCRVANVPEQVVTGDGMRAWLAMVRTGLREMNAKYPFMAYGTDWLAFGHLVIAMFFIGPIVKPVSNRWVIAVGLVACGCVVLTAVICGAIRGIPVWWRLIDCSFGVFGCLPLWVAWHAAGELAAISPAD